MRYSFILPCRNEEKTIGQCIDRICGLMQRMGIVDYEIIVSDSSIDRSRKIALEKGAKVVKHKIGYGDAYLSGFEAADGEILIMADSDGTYDFAEAEKFIDVMDRGYDFAIGNRKYIKKGAMPWLHRHIGNPLLSGMLNLFFKSVIKDSHCGMRAVRRECLSDMRLNTTGMEFASEMIIKALQLKLRIAQVNIHYYPRIGESKLRSFKDGWRHLRFMLLYAPDYLFILPGASLMLIGIVLLFAFLSGPVEFLGIVLYSRPMMLGSILTIVGFQIIMLGIYAKTYIKSINSGNTYDPMLENLAKSISFEGGIIAGLLAVIISAVYGLYKAATWISGGMPGMFGNEIIFAATSAIIGVQIMFSAFMISVLLIERR